MSNYLLGNRYAQKERTEENGEKEEMMCLWRGLEAGGLGE